MGLFDFLFSRSLSNVLTKTYRVKVEGVIFIIRKINPLDFMTGSKALLQMFDTYKTKPEKIAMESMDAAQTAKLKEHYADVFLAAVVDPLLVRKQEDSDKGIWVDNLFTDFELFNGLYLKIMELSYGKKKLRRSILRRAAW